ncbi:MAG: metallophosphoesterase [Paludibacteraceae bacterium]|nr:metallophosphoesterase [Paludibacteraceae bacterium]
MRKHILLILLLAWAAVSSAQMRLLVANDLGRNGYYEQKPIAERMGKMAGELDVEAVLALGDIHHFMGVESVNDPLWMTNYELIYSHPELQIPWYPILGNHEYRGNTQAVLDYSNVSRRWQMPARYYSKVFEEDGATLRVVFIDTTPLIGKYHKDSLDYPSVPQQDAKKQLAWLEEELNGAKEDWVVVVGHHPIYAHTTKSESERKDMQKRVDPILRRHNVDMYICGHIHNFQHLKPKDTTIDYVVNSAGSLARNKVEKIAGTVFASGEAGFSILSFTKDELCLDLVNAKGETIHSVKRTKNTQQ